MPVRAPTRRPPHGSEMAVSLPNWDWATAKSEHILYLGQILALRPSARPVGRRRHLHPAASSLICQLGHLSFGRLEPMPNYHRMHRNYFRRAQAPSQPYRPSSPPYRPSSPPPVDSAVRPTVDQSTVEFVRELLRRPQGQSEVPSQPYRPSSPPRQMWVSLSGPTVDRSTLEFVREVLQRYRGQSEVPSQPYRPSSPPPVDSAVRPAVGPTVDRSTVEFVREVLRGSQGQPELPWRPASPPYWPSSPPPVDSAVRPAVRPTVDQTTVEFTREPELPWRPSSPAYRPSSPPSVDSAVRPPLYDLDKRRGRFFSAMPKVPDATTVSAAVAVSSDERACVCCLQNVRDIICMPCNHVCVCAACARKIRDVCPVCRATITVMAQVYP